MICLTAKYTSSSSVSRLVYWFTTKTALMQGTEAEFLQTIELLLSKDNRRHKSQMDNSFLSESFY